jgi:hypothetical protein
MLLMKAHLSLLASEANMQRTREGGQLMGKAPLHVDQGGVHGNKGQVLRIAEASCFAGL